VCIALLSHSTLSHQDISQEDQGECCNLGMFPKNIEHIPVRWILSKVEGEKITKFVQRFFCSFFIHCDLVSTFISAKIDGFCSLSLFKSDQSGGNCCKFFY